MEEKTTWIYINNQDNSFRYVLGTKGGKTLFCFGINPSTATPDRLDPTIKRVESIAKNNNYDSFIMFNVYPKRDTNFKNLEKSINYAEHINNIEAITATIDKYSKLDILAAFGNHIYDRDYLPTCFKDIYRKLPQDKISWFATGVNKSGAPRHPLYQKKTAELIKFDMGNYIETLEKLS